MLLKGLNQILDDPGCLRGSGVNRVRGSILHKKGPRDDPGNYRFIGVSSVYIKLITAILTARLYAAVEADGLLDDSQFGFRKGFGVLESLLICERLHEASLEYEPELYQAIVIIMVDLFKCFPSTDKRMLAYLASCLGLEGTKIWETLMACHRDAIYEFKGARPGEPTESVQLINGLKEGCPSSPLIMILAYTITMMMYSKKPSLPIYCV